MFKFTLLCLATTVAAFGGMKTGKIESGFDPKVEPAAQIKSRQCSTDCGCGDDCTQGLMACGASEAATSCYGDVMGSYNVNGACLAKCTADFQNDIKQSMSPCVNNCYNSCNPATDWMNYCPEELQNYALCPNSWKTEECLPQCSEQCLTCVNECGDDKYPVPITDQPTDAPTDAAAATPGCIDDPTGDVAAAGSSCAMLKGMGCDTDIATMDPNTPAGTFVKMVCPASCDACPDVPTDAPTEAAPATSGCIDDPTGDVAAAGASCAMLKGMGCDTDIATMDPNTPAGTFVKMVCPVSCDACP